MHIEESIASFQNGCARIKAEVSKAVSGQREIIESVLIAILCGGHVLIEGVPGVGKTLLIRTFSDVLDLSFNRIQFTPDLMPADILALLTIVM